MLRKSAGLCFSAAVLAVFVVPAGAVNLVQNGSFQQTSLTGSDFMANSVTDWSTNSYTFLVFPGTAQTNIGNGVSLYRGLTALMPASSPDGGNFVAADGAFQSGPITQTIDGLISGHRYAVSFFQAGAQQQGFDGPTTDRFQVSLGLSSQFSALISNPTHDFSPWTKQTLTFQATTTGSEVLSFLSVGTPAGVPPFSLLDGVTLTETPEPATFALMGAACIGFVALRRRSKKRA
jgi:hypothetical protein